MKTQFLSIFIFAFVIGLYSCGGGSGSYDWSGSYVYEETAGPGMGGEPREYYYTIEVSQTDGEYKANYNLDGYQTMARYKCTAKVVDDKLVLYFEDFGEEHMMGGGYSHGDEVLTITKVDDKKFMVNDGTEMEFTKQ